MANIAWIGLILGIISHTAAELILLQTPEASHCTAQENESSSALAWITNLTYPATITTSSSWKNSNKDDQQSKELIDKLTCNLFEGKCDEWYKSSTLWNFSNFQVERNINLNPVKDYRWEDFQLYETDGKYVYYNPIKIEQRTTHKFLNFHFSVMAENNAFVILHDKENPHDNRTQVYWFMMDAFDGRRTTALRVCPSGLQNASYPMKYPACSQQKINTTIEAVFADRWTTFSVQLKEIKTNEVELSLWREGTQILAWKDSKPINVSYISFRTQGSVGYWKLHKYNLLRPKMKATISLSGELILPAPKSLCLSIIYFSENGTQKINVGTDVESVENNFKAGESWQVMRIETFISKNYNIEITSTDTFSTKFFIGDIRVCKSEEFHVSTLKKERGKCQNLETNESIVYSSPQAHSPILSCPATSFGDQCNLMCGLFRGEDKNCENTTLCYGNVCSCFAGYKEPSCSEKCPHGTYGWNCAMKCGGEHCSGNTCDHVTVACEKCHDGWEGTKCENVCSTGKYGENCDKNCNKNCKGQTCNHVNGTCDAGCEDGWHGPLCKLICPAGKYGSKCTSDCGEHCRSNTCNHITGACTAGCHDGWRGTKCEDMCADKWYGFNCSTHCGHCKDNNACDHVNGSCSECQKGWKSPLCNEKLPVVKEAPHPNNISYDTIVFTIANSSKINNMNLQIQYKATVEEEWKILGSEQVPPQIETYTIDELKPTTEYSIRVVLLEDKTNNYNDVGVPTLNVTTLCKPIDATQISFKSEENSITVHWDIPPDFGNCKVTDYKIQVDDGEIEAVTELPKVITKLNTSSTYAIKVHNNAIVIVEKMVSTEAANKSVALPILLSLLMVLLVVFAILGACWWRRRSGASKQEEDLWLQRNVSGGHDRPPQLDTINLVRSGSQRTKVAKPAAAAPPASPAKPPRTLAANETEVPAIKDGDKLSNLVDLNQLENYVETSLTSGELRRQHELFPRGQTQPWDYGKLPENKTKNRYGNLVAYDATRVKLAPLPGVPYSDYINANYIDGYKRPRAFIATQGPKGNTVNDFWRMSWQENVQVIVMLANVVENGKPKCVKYWPEVGIHDTFGDVTVQTLSQEVYADFTYRDLEVRCGDDVRKVLQLHFTSWPDHGVPCYPQSVAVFVKKVMTSPSNSGPKLVHCSAGVGRTGTILLVDLCLRMAAAERQMDPLGLLQIMRSQRPNMVDNYEQYEFVHLVLLECLLADTFEVECSKFPAHLKTMLSSGRNTLQVEFSKVNRICQKDAARKNFHNDLTWPVEKSRFPNIAPGSVGRVNLLSASGDSEFINAVYVAGFRTKARFIATQLPLPNTVTDFWQMVAQCGVGLVLVLNQPDPATDQTTCTFWPEDDFSLEVSTSINVTQSKHSQNRLYDTRSLHINIESMVQGSVMTERHAINLVTLKGWNVGQPVPPSTEGLLKFWEEAERIYSGRGPIVVMCHDGATASGLLLTVCFIVEKMKLEQKVDVGLAVRNVRLTRPHFVNTLDQFEFVHRVALTYLDSFSEYANFQ